jgi:predicted O-linked N-acetylglucosamine transferase (SPINDLY family)
MNVPLQDALQKYKAGDFHGLLKRHAATGERGDCPQILHVLLAQSHLKTGNDLKAAHQYRRAGEASGDNQLNYLLIAGSLFIRNSDLGQAYAVAQLALKRGPRDAKALEFHHRVLLESCLFAETEKAQAALLDGLARRDPLSLRSDHPFGNVSWCADEAINAAIEPTLVARPVTDEMRAARHARPHTWSDRLRIGYLSDDYYDTHATMHLLKGVILSHDAQRFEVTHFCFTSPANIARDSGFRKQIPNLVPIGHLDDTDAAALIRSRGIDILVDLKGHTQGSRPDLVNLGPAPLQVAWLGFPGSGNGIDCDYVISDRIVTPDASSPHYHEKFCRLPDTYQCNDNLLRPKPEPISRASLGLPEDKVVLGFFNATRKLTPQTFRLIVDGLKASDDAVLWILFFNSFAETNFRAAITAAGIDPNRVITAPKALYPQHLARLPAIDIALDSFPYNGHTTTSDLLWAGVPVVTFRGTHFASRVSESLLAALGLSELVADDAAGYVVLVGALAADPARRQALRETIAANRTEKPLFDTRRFTRHLERAFEMIAERARKGLPPDHIDVPPIEVEENNSSKSA